jgi:hypothetical protein
LKPGQADQRCQRLDDHAIAETGMDDTLFNWRIPLLSPHTFLAVASVLVHFFLCCSLSPSIRRRGI